MERFALRGPYLPSRCRFRGRHCCEVNCASGGRSPRNIGLEVLLDEVDTLDSEV